MLAKMAVIADPNLPRSVPLEVRTSSNIRGEVEVMRVSTEESWMDSILSYIRDDILLEDKKQARKLKCRAARYTLLNGVFYHPGFTLPILRCLDDEEVDYVLREIHEGICGNHSGVELGFSRHFGKGTSGQPCTRMRRGWQKTVKYDRTSRRFLFSP